MEDPDLRTSLLAKMPFSHRPSQVGINLRLPTFLVLKVVSRALDFNTILGPSLNICVRAEKHGVVNSDERHGNIEMHLGRTENDHLWMNIGSPLLMFGSMTLRDVRSTD